MIDLSNNKIKRLPSTLNSSLQVLSLANNKVTVLSSCVVEAPALKILDVEGNPIMFPPKEVLRKKKGATEEDWLVEVREWLVENGLPCPALPLSSPFFSLLPALAAFPRDGLTDGVFFLLVVESSVFMSRPRGNLESKESALQRLAVEQEQLKELLRIKQQEELSIMADDNASGLRRHSSQSKE